MYPRTIQSIALLLSLTLFLSCQQEPESESDLNLNNDIIPSDILPYFSEFERQAGLRGLLVDLSNTGITAEFRDVDEGNVAGICTTNNHDYRLITIDINFWQNASGALREMVVFHELGHCFLGRGHREDAFANGLCKSIMRSGTGSCQDAYIADNRPYYLDELFFEMD